MKSRARWPYIFIFILVFWGFSSDAELPRPLKTEEIKKLENNIIKDPDNVNSRRFLADHFALQSNWKQVARYLSPVAENLPVEYVHLLVNAHLHLQQVREADSFIRIALSAKKVSLQSYLLAVKVYAEKIRKYSQTVHAESAQTELFETLKIAQQSFPQHIEVYDLWLDCLEEFVPHYQFEALKVIDDMVANKIELRDKHASLMCKYNHMAGYPKQTRVTCEAAIEREPDNPSNYIYLGQTHINNGEKEKGMRMLASVGKKFSKSEEALWAAANAHYENKNLSLAYDYYKKAIQHKDAKPRDFLGFAKVAFELKKYDEALQSFDRHCLMTKILDHEFRRASGMLKDGSYWKNEYRSKMENCTKK